MFNYKLSLFLGPSTSAIQQVTLSNDQSEHAGTVMCHKIHNVYKFFMSHVNFKQLIKCLLMFNNKLSVFLGPSTSGIQQAIPPNAESKRAGTVEILLNIFIER